MIRRPVTLFCIGMMLSVMTAYAEENADPSSPPMLTAEQIVEKNVAARGGLKAWRAVSTMSMAGMMDAGRLRTTPQIVTNNLHKVKMDLQKKVPEGNVIQLPFVMDIKRPLKMRVELQFQGDTAVQTFDGINGWKLRPFLGRHEVEPYTSEEMKSASQQQQLDGFLIDYAAKGTKVEFEGIEKVEGRDNYKLKLTLKNGQIRHTWIDAHTFMDTRIDGSRRMDGRPRVVMTNFRDYKLVDGLMIPFTLETTVEGVRDPERITIEKVIINPQLADSRFARPE